MSALALDPAVPQRDALLDPRAAAGMLSERLLSGRRARVRVAFVKYRAGDSLRVAYRVRDGRHVRHVAVRTFAGERSGEVYRRALATAVPSGDLPPVAHAPELGAVLWAFPNDRRLAGLAMLDGDCAPLARLLGRELRAHLVAYAPERSATARCLDGDGRVVAYAKLPGGAERRGLEAVAGAGVRLPRVLACGEDDAALLLEPLAGRPLAALRAAELPEALRRLGAALAELHAAPPPAVRFDRLDPGRLATAAAVVARTCPGAALPAERLLARLVVRAPEPEPPVCLHGDANLRNALLTRDGTPALIDLEHVAAGPASADLGQVLAALLARGADAGPLLAGYGRPPDPAALRWHTAACVLARIALPAVTRVRPPLLRRLPALLDAAGALLA